MKKSTLITFTIVLISFSVFAGSGGYNNDLSDSRAMANATAVNARPKNAAANWYNPAGITELSDKEITITAINEFLYIELDSVTGKKIDAEDKYFFIPNIFYTQKLSDQLSFGIGLNSPYGIGTEWRDDVIKYVTTEANLTMLNINPNIAYKVNDQLSVAFGLDLAYLKGEISKNISQTLLNYSLTLDWVNYNDALSKLEGDDWNIGWNAALLYKINEQWNFGLSYRAKMEPELEGDTTINGLQGASALVFGGTNYTVNTLLDFLIPASINFGLAYQINDKTSMELDLEWAGWSDMEQLYSRFQGETNPVRLLILNTGNPIKKDWDDTWNFAFGVEHEINDTWTVAAGFRYRPTPVPDETYEPMVPAMDLYDIHGGGMFKIDEKQSVDFSVTYLWGDRTVNNLVGSDVLTTINGEYGIKVVVIGVSYNRKI